MWPTPNVPEDLQIDNDTSEGYKILLCGKLLQMFNNFYSNTFSIARSVQFNVLGTAKGVRNGDFHGDSDLSVKVADLLEMKQKSTLKADKGLSAAKNIPL